MFFEKATSGLNDWYRYVLTILAVMFSFTVLGTIPLYGYMQYIISTNDNIGVEELEKFTENTDFSAFGISSNLGLLLMLLIFVITFVVLMLCVRYLHQMPFNRLVSPLKKINWNKILFGFGLWMGIGFLAEGIAYFMNPDVYTFQFKPLSFLILLIISLLVMPIQTSMEELFFRGYLMPWMGRLIQNKWVPLIVTSVLFGMIHGNNPEVAQFGYKTMMFYYISAGLFLGLITILEDSLELALGVHAATNIFGSLFFSFEGSVLQTDSLMRASEINPYFMIVALYVGAILFYLICAKKYNWSGFSKLMEPVAPFTNQPKALDQAV